MGLTTAIMAGGAILGGLSTMSAADKAARASRQASQTQATSQREALDYLKQQDKVPQAYREQALGKLGEIYGLPGMPGMGSMTGGSSVPSPYTDREGFISGLSEDPFFEMMAGEGEEAVMRGASATGGLRSGSTSENLARVRNEALMNIYGQRMNEFQGYAGGLQGMLGTPSLAPQIAGSTAGIGKTLSQGQVAAAQAKQKGTQGFGNAALTALGSLSNVDFGGFGAPSDYSTGYGIPDFANEYAGGDFI